MSYPDHIGPDPELSAREHLRRLRASLARIVFRGGREKLPMVEERDFTLSHGRSDEYLSVHHEHYNAPRFFLPRHLLPGSAGDVTVVATPSRHGKGEFDYFVAAAFPDGEGSERLLMDCVAVRKAAKANMGTYSLELADETGEVLDFFEDKVTLPAGSETFTLLRTSLSEIMERLEPDDIVRPNDAEYVVHLQNILQELLDVIGYSGSDTQG